MGLGLLLGAPLLPDEEEAPRQEGRRVEDDGHEEEDLLGVVSLLLGVIGPCLCRVYVCEVVGSSERGPQPQPQPHGLHHGVDRGPPFIQTRPHERSSRQPVHSALWIAADKLKAAWLAPALAQYLSTHTHTQADTHLNDLRQGAEARDGHALQHAP